MTENKEMVKQEQEREMDTKLEEELQNLRRLYALEKTDHAQTKKKLFQVLTAFNSIADLSIKGSQSVTSGVTEKMGDLVKYTNAMVQTQNNINMMLAQLKQEEDEKQKQLQQEQQNQKQE